MFKIQYAPQIDAGLVGAGNLAAVNRIPRFRVFALFPDNAAEARRGGGQGEREALRHGPAISHEQLVCAARQQVAQRERVALALAGRDVGEAFAL